MTLYRYQDQVTDEHLHPVPNVQVWVFEAGDPEGLEASLTNDSGVALTQPIETDTDGIFYYNTVGGLYENHVHYAGELKYVQQAQLGPLDPVSPDGILALVCASRVDLANVPISHGAAFLIEPGREGYFVIDAKANWTAKIAADTAQGLFVLSSVDATKVWRRSFVGFADARWFGAKADDNPAGTGTDNYAAITAAIAALKAFVVAPTGVFVGDGNGGGPIGLSIQGHYYCSQRLYVNYALHVRGFGSKVNNGTHMRWPVNQGGWFFDLGAWGWTLENMALKGGWVGGDEGEYHALQFYSFGTHKELLIDSWQGDGVYNRCSTGEDPNRNSNGTNGLRLWIQQCRRGYFINGNNTNAAHIEGICCIANRWAGIHCKDTFGSTFTGILMENNGIGYPWMTGAANRPCSYVRYSGRRFAVVGGQETWASTNAPPATATNNQGWIYIDDQPGSLASSGIPDWVSGLTLRAGGGILHQGLSDISTFSGYSEGGTVSQFDQNVGLITGQMPASQCWIVSSGILAPAPLSNGFNQWGSRRFQTNPGGSLGLYSPNFFWGYPKGGLPPEWTSVAVDLLHQHYATNYYHLNNFYSYAGTGTATQDATTTVGQGAISLQGAGAIYLNINAAYNSLVSGGQFGPTADNAINLGAGATRWKQLYAATATISTSDQRQKQNIKAIADKALDAWADVDWLAYRDKAAVKDKGEGARLHIGLIAQRVEKAFEKHKLDPFAFGLLCFDKWDDQLHPKIRKAMKVVDEGQPPIEVEEHVRDKNGKPVMECVNPAGDRYGIRYAEALAMEAAYQRRRCDRLEARLAKLEAKP